MRTKCGRNADEMRTKSERNADEMRTKCGRNADEMRTKWQRMPKPATTSGIKPATNLPPKLAKKSYCAPSGKRKTCHLVAGFTLWLLAGGRICQQN